MSDDFQNPHKNLSDWKRKFAVAGRGVYIGFVQEKSFLVHSSIIVLVLGAGFAFGISRVDWCIVTLCIMSGLSAELLNTAIERLSLAVSREYNPHICDALDLASGAVFIVSLGATVLGVLVLGNALWECLA
jgi:diacylglycerol kinase